MKLRYMFLIFLGAFLIQSTLLNQLSLFGVTPNLMLCLVMLFSFWFEGYGAMSMGILFGLLQDLCFGKLMGIAAICYFLLSLGIWLTKHLLYRDNILSVFFLTLVGTCAYELMYWALHVTMGGTAHILYMLSILPLLIIYNCIVTIGIHLIFGRRLVRFPGDRYF